MSNLKDLRSLLNRCTTRITLSNKPNERGTGFFVAPGTILTCAHVVENAQMNQAPVLISWNNQSYTASTEQFTDKIYPDLALLKVNQAIRHPCVYFSDEVQTDDKLYSFGYTDNYPDGDPATFVCEGLTSGEQPLIRFKFGEVRAGLSGGPLLNERTGSICGVVKRTRGPDTIMGGRAIPAATVLREFPELSIQQQQFHQQDRQWYNVMSPEQRKESGMMKQTLTNGAIEVFFSYAEDDKNMLRELLKQMSILKRLNYVNAWYEGKLTPTAGEIPSDQIMQHLNSAQIIVLLISPDYMYSEDLNSTHVERAMQRHLSGETTVIPVLLRSIYDWQEAPFGKLLAIPRNGKPINKWSDKDEAFAEVAKEIRGVVNNLRQQKAD